MLSLLEARVYSGLPLPACCATRGCVEGDGEAQSRESRARSLEQEKERPGVTGDLCTGDWILDSGCSILLRNLRAK